MTDLTQGPHIDPWIPAHDTAPPGDDVLSSLDETLRILQRIIGFSDGTAMAMDPDVLIPMQFVATFQANEPQHCWRAGSNSRNTTCSSFESSPNPTRMLVR